MLGNPRRLFQPPLGEGEGDGQTHYPDEQDQGQETLSRGNGTGLSIELRGLEAGLGSLRLSVTLALWLARVLLAESAQFGDFVEDDLLEGNEVGVVLGRAGCLLHLFEGGAQFLDRVFSPFCAHRWGRCEKMPSTSDLVAKGGLQSHIPLVRVRRRPVREPSVPSSSHFG